MLELSLLAALLTADATVRESEAFALAGELGRFPAAVIVSRDAEFAREHLDWLEGQETLGPLVTWVTREDATNQRTVTEVYRKLGYARAELATIFERPDPRFAENEDGEYETADTRLEWVRDYLARIRRLIGDDDYFAGRLPAPVTSQRYAYPRPHE
jgi:hypothetical protein